MSEHPTDGSMSAVPSNGSGRSAESLEIHKSLTAHRVQLSNLSARLEKARVRLSEREPGPALNLADGIITEMESILYQAIPTGSDPTRPLKILASACVVKGLSLHWMMRMEESTESFKKAAALFDSIGSLAGGQSKSDCGIAMHEVGRSAEAVILLREALDLEQYDLWTYLYLAFALISEEKLQEAEELLRESTQVVTSEPILSRLLANLIENQGRPEEAARAFVDAAYDQIDLDVQEAGNLIKHALELDPESQEALSAQVYFLYQTGQYEECITEIEKLGDSVLNIPNMQFFLGASLRQMQRFDDALAALDRGLSVDAEFAAAWYEKGLTLNALGLYDDALQALEKFRALVPGNVLGIAQVGHVLLNASRFEEAVSELQKAIEINDGIGWIFADLAWAYYSLANYDEVEKSSRRALELEPDNAGTLAVHGAALRQLDRMDEAMAAFDEALRLNPTMLFALLEKGVALAVLERNEESLKIFDQILDLYPEHPTALAQKGRLLREFNQPDQSVLLLKKAIGLDPSITWTNTELGLSLYDLKKYAEAQKAFKKALKIDPQDLQALLFSGICLNVLGKHQDALKVLNRALDIAPDSTAVLIEAGAVLGDLERYEEGLEKVNRAVELDSSNAYALANQGSLLRAMGHPEEALDPLNKAVKIDPSIDWAFYEIGGAHYDLDKYEESLTALEQCLSLNPGNVQAKSLKASALRLLGQCEDALVLLAELIKPDEDNYWLLSEKALALSALKQFQPALDTFELALRADQTNSFVLYQYANLRAIAGDFQGALDLLHQIKDPGYNALHLIGWAYENLGKQHAADSLEAYTKALALEPGFPDKLWTRKGQANAFHLMKKRKEAEDIYREVIEYAEHPNEETESIGLNDLISWCHYRLGNYDEALRLMRESMAELPDRYDIYFDFGLSLVCSGRYGAALDQYKRTIEVISKIDHLEQNGLIHVAIDDLEEALSDNPDLQSIDEVRQCMDLLKQSKSSLLIGPS